MAQVEKHYTLFTSIFDWKDGQNWALEERKYMNNTWNILFSKPVPEQGVYKTLRSMVRQSHALNIDIEVYGIGF